MFPSPSRPLKRKVPHPSRPPRSRVTAHMECGALAPLLQLQPGAPRFVRVGLGFFFRRPGLQPRRKASRAIWALAPEDSALVFPFDHAANSLNLRVPHPSRFVRRVGSYALTLQPLFSSLLGFLNSLFCSGRPSGRFLGSLSNSFLKENINVQRTTANPIRHCPAPLSGRLGRFPGLASRRPNPRRPNPPHPLVAVFVGVEHRSTPSPHGAQGYVIPSVARNPSSIPRRQETHLSFRAQRGICFFGPFSGFSLTLNQSLLCEDQHG